MIIPKCHKLKIYTVLRYWCTRKRWSHCCGHSIQNTHNLFKLSKFNTLLSSVFKLQSCIKSEHINSHLPFSDTVDYILACRHVYNCHNYFVINTFFQYTKRESTAKYNYSSQYHVLYTLLHTTEIRYIYITKLITKPSLSMTIYTVNCLVY